MEMLCYWHSFVAFHTGGVQGVQATCALCNKQCPQFAKSALHHAGLESHLQTKLPPLSLLLNVQPKPGCLASSSVLPVPNVQVAGEGEQALQGRLLWGWGTSSWLGPWRSSESAGQLSAQGSRYCFSSWSLESARLLASVFWPMAMRTRRLSFWAKWTDSGRLCIFTTTMQKSGLANKWGIRDIRKQGSLHCCRGTFNCPTLLDTTLLQTRSSTYGIIKGMSGYQS